MNALQTTDTNSGAQVMMKQATDVAGLCKAIVLKTAKKIQNKQYVQVEGWQAIATAHGCVAGSRDVEKIEGGFRAIGEIRRMSDGALLVTAEGFVGDDEKTWASRPEYARRAMAQTRAISRACRSAFAHVVVLIDSGLSTTPAEEVPDTGFNDQPQPKMATLDQIATIRKLLSLEKVGKDEWEAAMKRHKADTLEDLPYEAAEKAIAWLKSKTL